MEPVEIGQGQIRAYADEAVSKEEIPKYLDAAARFPQMPWYNILLTFKQMPGAEILCGIRAWKKYGAALRRGEKPVMLLSPVAVRHGALAVAFRMVLTEGFQVGKFHAKDPVAMALLMAGLPKAGLLTETEQNQNWAWELWEFMISHRSSWP